MVVLFCRNRKWKEENRLRTKGTVDSDFLLSILDYGATSQRCTDFQIPKLSLRCAKLIVKDL
jgi:hypothetical protein